jgi:Peptidase family M28
MIAAVVLAASLAAPSGVSAAEVRAIDAALVACGTRHSLSSWDDPHRGIGCGRDVVVAAFTEAAKQDPGARVVVDRFEATAKRTHDKPVPLENVYLVLRGSDPSLKTAAVLISGHYDSIGSDVFDATGDAPGADDDASGVTVSIASARLLAGRPRRATIVLAAVAGEEQGLLGGKRLLEWVRSQGLTVIGMLDDDIVGATNGSEDARPRLFCDDDPGSPSRQLGLWIEEALGPKAVRLVFRKDRFGRGGDHLPFVEAGLPAVRFTEPREDYRHEHQTPRVEHGVAYGDLPDFMDFDFLARVAGLNAAAAASLANAPLPPATARVLGAVQPDAVLTFEAPPDPGRSGFEILVRETSETRFRPLRSVEAAGSYVLPGLTIDDLDFAVRSKGLHGETSLAIPAVPTLKRPPAAPAAK